MTAAEQLVRAKEVSKQRGMHHFQIIRCLGKVPYPVPPPTHIPCPLPHIYTHTDHTPLHTVLQAEVEDLRRAYEALALDHRRAESTAAQLEREAAMREAALAARVDEVASLHEATRAAHVQNNQYVMDLQVCGGGVR